MFRAKRTKQAPPPEVDQVPMPSDGYQRSELTTFDGTGNPSVIVYSTDATGKIIKTRRKEKRGDK